MAAPVRMGTFLQANPPEDAAPRDEGLCVVGIFGKSSLRSGAMKEPLLNALADRRVFPPFGGAEGGDAADPDAQDSIQAFYQQENRVLYLLLSSVCDSRRLLRACRALSSGAGHSAAQDALQQLERSRCLHLLYLFSVSHVLLLVQPNQTFDVTYDRLFRAVDALRQKVLPLIRAAIKDCPVSKEWKLNARPCPPRLLFVFHMSCGLKVHQSSYLVCPCCCVLQ